MENIKLVPKRHPIAQQLVDFSNTLKALEIGKYGAPEYAGDRPNPRPIPNYSIYDYRNRFNEYLRSNVV